MCVAVAQGVSGESPGGARLRGATPEVAAQFAAALEVEAEVAWKCVAMDGGPGEVQLPLGVVNDGYCDCADGSDEPGSSACSGAVLRPRFWCVNEGHEPEAIPSAWVDDGVCDCCDGSDEEEAAGGVACPNTCVAQGHEALRGRIEALKVHEAGLEAKAALQVEAEAVLEGWRRELAEVEAELPALEAAQKAAKQATDEAEVVEKAENDAKKAAWEEDKAKWEAEHPQAEGEDGADANSDANEAGEGAGAGEGAVETAEREGKEIERERGDDKEDADAEAKRVMSQWIKDDPAMPEPLEGEVLDGGGDNIDDSQGEQGEAENDEAGGEAEEVTQPAAKYPIEFEEHIDPRATELREQLQEAERKLREQKDRASSLKGDLDNKAGVLLPLLTGGCLEHDDGKYTYEVCPFKEATQREGKSRTRLGKYDSLVEVERGGAGAKQAGGLGAWLPRFSGSTKGRTTGMLFKGGAKCWNGPERSLNVTFRCGSETRVVGVKEPTMCAYAADLVTPLACDVEVASALREELVQRLEVRGETLEQHGLVTHDEL